MPNLTKSATAAGDGTIVFAFQPASLGAQQVGTLQVISSPPLAEFSIEYGSPAASTQLGTTQGSNLFGGVTIPPQNGLIVRGTGLTPGKQYSAVFNMNQESATNPDTNPTPYGNSLVAAQGIPGGFPVAVAAGVELLTDFSSADFGAGIEIDAGFAPIPLQTIVVCLNVCPATQQAPALRVRSGVGGGQFMAASQMQTQQLAVGSDIGPQFFVPVAVRFGDSILIDTADAMTQTPGVSVYTGTVYGLGMPFCPYPLRSDGRLMPQGANSTAEAQDADPFNVELVASANPNGRILVCAASIVTGTSLPEGGIFGVQAVVGGGGVELAYWNVFAPGGTGNTPTIVDRTGIATPAPPEGLLCDVNTPITYAGAGDGVTPVSGGVTWDYVM